MAAAATAFVIVIGLYDWPACHNFASKLSMKPTNMIFNSIFKIRGTLGPFRLNDDREKISLHFLTSFSPALLSCSCDQLSLKIARRTYIEEPVLFIFEM